MCVSPAQKEWFSLILTYYLVQQSVSQNPYFFRTFAGFIVPPVAHAFIFRMFANKSAAYPEGFLDRNTLKSFYAMTGSDNSNLIYTPGAERIPENWYKRAPDDLYESPFAAADILALIQQHPELAALGGNTGTVNSFTGLSVTNLTVSIMIFTQDGSRTIASIAVQSNIVSDYANRAAYIMRNRCFKGTTSHVSCIKR